MIIDSNTFSSRNLRPNRSVRSIRNSNQRDAIKENHQTNSKLQQYFMGKMTKDELGVIPGMIENNFIKKKKREKTI